MSELLPEIGDRLHIGAASVAPGEVLNTFEIGGIDHYRRFGKPYIEDSHALELMQALFQGPNNPRRTRAFLVDAFFADLFGQPAAKPRDRKATCLLTELVLASSDEASEQSADAIAYPSVAHRGGLNFAIKPDSFDGKMQWDEFIVIEIKNYLGFGLYAYDQVATANGIQSGRINWTTHSND